MPSDRTTSTDTLPDATAADRHVYSAPAVTPLGTIAAVTAGPVVDGGNIDQLVGQVGGFNITSEPTS